MWIYEIVPAAFVHRFAVRENFSRPSTELVLSERSESKDAPAGRYAQGDMGVQSLANRSCQRAPIRLDIELPGVPDFHAGVRRLEVLQIGVVDVDAAYEP